jgi:hypothetical protein
MNSLNQSTPPIVDAGLMGHALALVTAMGDLAGVKNRLAQITERRKVLPARRQRTILLPQKQQLQPRNSMA